MLLRTWEGWLQQRGKRDFVGERAKANRERTTPNAKKWDSVPCQFGDDRFIWFTAFNASHQHYAILSVTTCTAGQVHFLSGNEHVFSFLEPSQVLAPHKAGSAKTSRALLLQPAVGVSETSAKLAQLTCCSWGGGLLGKEGEHCSKIKTQQRNKSCWQWLSVSKVHKRLTWKPMKKWNKSVQECI